MGLQILSSPCRRSPSDWFDDETTVATAAEAPRFAIFAHRFGALPDSAPLPFPKRTRAATPLPNWRLKRVVNYIDDNIAEPISLADLASVAGLSRMHFASQFRAATGFSPHDYLLRKRVERAQHLLSCTAETLVEVTLSVGFQTQSHFTTVFKKIAGATPNQWRHQHRALQAARPVPSAVERMPAALRV